MTGPNRPGPADMDLGNPLLAPCPWKVNLRLGQGPEGPPHLITTFRSGNATLTAFLSAAEVDDLIGRLQAKRATMGLIVPPNGRPR